MKNIGGTKIITSIKFKGSKEYYVCKPNKIGELKFKIILLIIY